MPSCAKGTRCLCIQCASKGGLDATGHPNGIMMPSRLLPAHLARVQAEQAEIEARDINSAEAQMFALALTDCGPDPSSQPSKLWTSRAEFQGSASHNHRLPDHSSSLPINDILEGVTRLSVSATMPSSQHLGNISPTHAAFVRVPANLPDNINVPLSTSDVPLTTAQPSANRQLQKRERNRRTANVLQVFDQIDLRLDACRVKVSETPTHDVLRELESALNDMHHAVDKVKRSTPTIDARKHQISQNLVSLDARIAQWKQVLPDLKDPIVYQSGE